MNLDLIDGFGYYLILTFAVGTVLRARNYRAMMGIVYTSGERWPKLRAVIASHRSIFLRWPTALPLAVTFLLASANAIAAHFVWPSAQVTPSDLWAHRSALAVTAITAGLMVILDCKAVFDFVRLDRASLEGVLDRAEGWLGSWKSPVVRVLTFGLIHPRRIVGEQVRIALVDVCLAANGALWEMSLQIGVRFAFGLALWVTWAVALR
jgi:hypothetical protein